MDIVLTFLQPPAVDGVHFRRHQHWLGTADRPSLGPVHMKSDAHITLNNQTQASFWSCCVAALLMVTPINDSLLLMMAVT